MSEKDPCSFSGQSIHHFNNFDFVLPKGQSTEGQPRFKWAAEPVGLSPKNENKNLKPA